MGTDAKNGRRLAGWPHVVQSLGIVWTTSLGERVMREWFGASLRDDLGKSLTKSRAIVVMQKISVAAELWERRFKVQRVTPQRLTSGGLIGFRIDGEYRPRGHLGDPTPEGARSLLLGANGVEQIS